MKLRKYIIITSATALTLLSGFTVYAEKVPIVRDVAVIATAARTPFTAQMLNLKPVVNPLKAPDMFSVVVDTTEEFDIKGVMTKQGSVYFDDNSTRAFGSFGIPYTTTSVVLGSTYASGASIASLLSSTYPYRTIGKLTFSAGYCSASLIRKSVIVTAAHCIQRFGSGNTIYTGFQYRPGHYGPTGATAAQIAPYGTWTGATLVRPASWSAGTDIGCGAARDNDLAVIALNKNARGQFVGDFVGYMSYGWNNYSFVSSPKTGNLSTAEVSTLGYPGLMDSGRIMQRTDGPTYKTTVCNAGQLWQGSNLTGGSSGGPWIVNFSGRNAALSGGAVAGTAPVMAVIGVTSWGSSDPNRIKDNYSSQFRQNARYPLASYGIYGAGNIASLLNTLCSSAAPGGGTFASRGYCN
jgi:hypothetical protein